MSADGCDEKMSVKRLVLYINTRDGIVELYAHQKSLVADFFHMGQSFQSLCEIVSDLLCVAGKIAI